MSFLATRGGAVKRYSALASLLLAILGWATLAALARATVTAGGDVTPAPPAVGGTVSGTFKIGGTGVGTLSIAFPSGSTTPSALTVTGGGSIYAGDGTGSVGIVQMTGLGNNLTTTADLTVGNSGTGSVSVSQLAQFIIGDDLFLATAAGSQGSLFVDGLGSIVDVHDTVIVGDAGSLALLQVTGGGRINLDDSILGQSAGGLGRMTISGNSSIYAAANSITVGDAGRGEMTIQSQGTANTLNAVVGNAATGTGIAVVTGAGSNWKITGFLNLGVGGTATLNVLDGAQTSTTSTLRMATTAASESHAVINGVNTLFTVGTTVTVGEVGYGTLDVRGGSHMTSTNAVIADNAGSRGEVLVDGAGSQWKITGTLDVSDPGEAQLAITGGGQVITSGVTRIAAAGRVVMSTGRLEAGGTGVTNNGLIQGTGRIVGNVSNTSTGKIRLSAGNSMVLANALTNAGLVDLDGAELETLGVTTNTGDIDMRNSTLRVGSTGLANSSGGQLSATEGTVDVYGVVTNNVGAQIVVGGKSTAVFHDTLTNNGQFFAFAGSDVLALENLSFSPTAALSMQFGLIDTTDEAGQIEAAGTAGIAGALAVTLAPGFTPSAGDSFTVVSAANGVSGTFATTALPALAGGLTWDLDYAATNVTLNVIAALTADFDLDGDVDAMDLGKWKTGFGKTSGAVKADGDADGDGDVDGVDFMAWQQQLGSGSPATVASNAVPEPGTFALLASGLALVAGTRGRGKWR